MGNLSKGIAVGLVATAIMGFATYGILNKLGSSATTYTQPGLPILPDIIEPETEAKLGILTHDNPTVLQIKPEDAGVVSDTHIKFSGRVTKKDIQVIIGTASVPFYATMLANGNWEANIPRDILMPDSLDDTIDGFIVEAHQIQADDSLTDNILDSAHIQFNLPLYATSIDYLKNEDKKPLTIEPLRNGALIPTGLKTNVPWLKNKITKEEIWHIANVTSGDYVDYGLYRVQGFGFNNPFGSVLISPDTQDIINLIQDGTAKSAYGNLGKLNDLMIIKDDFTYYTPIDSFAPELSISDSKYKLVLANPEYKFNNKRPFIKNEYSLLGKTTDGLDILSEKETNRLSVLYSPNTVVDYFYDIPFIDETKVPQITWRDKSTNSTSYNTGEWSGCGQTTPYNIIEANLDSRQFVVAGVTSNGEKVYELSNQNDARLKKLHADYGWTGHNDTLKPIAYADFIASRPIFFWEAPHKQVVMFTNANYQPFAECGKPVIYLYPPTDQLTKVRVNLDGHFTVTEPEHGPNGWTVLAHPDGFVTNLADDKKYPYLFWEGVGVNFEAPQTGFVVAQKHLATWLPQTLDEIGFTTREKQEFIEFWLPRLPKSPYVFISFIDQSNLDRDAALAIQPTPNTVNRIFMDYKPLAEYKTVPTQALPKIKRHGFTVVEWGGTLY